VLLLVLLLARKGAHFGACGVGRVEGAAFLLLSIRYMCG
jgi:hypothetical protein